MSPIKWSESAYLKLFVEAVKQAPGFTPNFDKISKEWPVAPGEAAPSTRTLRERFNLVKKRRSNNCASLTLPETHRAHNTPRQEPKFNAESDVSQNSAHNGAKQNLLRDDGFERERTGSGVHSIIVPNVTVTPTKRTSRDITPSTSKMEKRKKPNRSRGRRRKHRGGSVSEEEAEFSEEGSDSKTDQSETQPNLPQPNRTLRQRRRASYAAILADESEVDNGAKATDSDEDALFDPTTDLLETISTPPSSWRERIAQRSSCQPDILKNGQQ